MPGGDRTGPMGAGPMTGRGAGMCAGYDVPGYMDPAFSRGSRGGRGRGFGRGFQGGGRGWRHQYYATGLPGWARRDAYPYPHQRGYAVAPDAPVNVSTAQADELVHLKRQARYFKEALEDIETRLTELQQAAKDDSDDKPE